jgi:hypothetical protein
MTLNPIKPVNEEQPVSPGGLAVAWASWTRCIRSISKDEYDAARKRLIDESIAPIHQTVITPSSQ